MSRQARRDRNVGVVLGIGGIPAVIPHTGLGEFYVADYYAHVITGAIRRARLINPRQGHWTGYRGVVEASLDESDRKAYGNEWKDTAKLRGDFKLACSAIARTALHPLEGDIRDTAPVLGQQLEDEGKFVGFLNLTNVGEYVGLPSIELGRRVLRSMVIDVLPMAADAVIIDSGSRCEPELYTLRDYGR